MAIDSPHDSDPDWAVNRDLNSHFYSDLGREYINAAQYPGSAPFNPPHLPTPPFAAEVSDSSHQGYPEHPSSFPIPQQVLGQVAFPSMGPVTPSGAAIPPASYPQHLRWPPIPPSYYPPYGPRLYMSSAPPGRLDIGQPIPVSMVSSTGHVHPSFSAPILRRSRASAAPRRPRAHQPSQKPPVPCPVSVCDVVSKRPQERDRHVLRHLPCSIVCSSGGCTWTGYRLDTFRKHSCDDHQSTTPGSRHGYYRLYNPSPLVDWIVKGSISLEDAKQLAIKEINTSVHTHEWLEESSGRKGKKSQW